MCLCSKRQTHEEARSAPQKNKRLQAIHEAHAAVVSKEAAIEEAERAVAALINADKATAQQLQEEVCVCVCVCVSSKRSKY